MVMERKEHDHEKDITLKVKLGIGVGRATVMHVGGVYGRLEYLAAGAPLVQAYGAEHNAAAGDIIVSNKAWKMVRDSFHGNPIAEGFVKIEGVTNRIRNHSLKNRKERWVFRS